MLETIKRRLATRQNILREVVAIMRECAVNNVVKHFKTLKPTVLQINVNSQCNTKCGMCNIWRTQDKTKVTHG